MNQISVGFRIFLLQISQIGIDYDATFSDNMDYGESIMFSKLDHFGTTVLLSDTINGMKRFEE